MYQCVLECNRIGVCVKVYYQGPHLQLRETERGGCCMPTLLYRIKLLNGSEVMQSARDMPI